MINPNDYPIRIAGIAWRDLQKGETIPSHKVEEMFDILFKKADVMSPESDQAINFKLIRVREWLQEARELLNKPLVIKQIKGNLYVLTDAEALEYLNQRAYSGLKSHRKNTRYMFTRVDKDNLSGYEKTQLETNQARHAFIASAADGARKQELKLKRDGGEVPKINPPDM